MTADEIATHAMAAFGFAGPALGAFWSERTKRKTAEAQTTEHVAKAISSATAGIRTTLEMTADIAKAAMKKATESEQKAAGFEEKFINSENSRETERKDCGERIDDLEKTIAAQKEAEAQRDIATQDEFKSLHKLISELAPSATVHQGLVE
jgi:hypothetical protein